MKHQVAIKVNGLLHRAEIEPRTLLVHFLRRQIGLKSPHVGCDTSNCGACSVIMNGRCVKSCTIFAAQADGAEILTAEGLAGDDNLHPLQEAFRDNHALQCGYCTPGFLMASYALLQHNSNPSEEEIRIGLSGNLCMCTGYINIIKAVRSAAEMIRQSGGSGLG